MAKIATSIRWTEVTKWLWVRCQELVLHRNRMGSARGMVKLKCTLIYQPVQPCLAKMATRWTEVTKWLWERCQGLVSHNNRMDSARGLVKLRCI